MTLFLQKYSLFIMAAFLIISCQDREGCTDPSSDNFDINAEIENGTCIPMTEKFLGLYDVVEECEFEIYTYPMSIYASFNDPYEIVITNFGDLGIDVIAFVDRRAVALPNQYIQSDGAELAIIDGRGEIVNGNLVISYYYGQNGSDLFLCGIDGLRY